MVRIEAKADTKKSSSYPKLMISKEDGAIVLFTGYEEGVCLRVGEDDVFGEHSSVWNMSVFSDFNGSITLSNEG